MPGIAVVEIDHAKRPARIRVEEHVGDLGVVVGDAGGDARAREGFDQHRGERGRGALPAATPPGFRRAGYKVSSVAARSRCTRRFGVWWNSGISSESRGWPVRQPSREIPEGRGGGEGVAGSAYPVDAAAALDELEAAPAIPAGVPQQHATATQLDEAQHAAHGFRSRPAGPQCAGQCEQVRHQRVRVGEHAPVQPLEEGGAPPSIDREAAAPGLVNVAGPVALAAQIAPRDIETRGDVAAGITPHPFSPQHEPRSIRRAPSPADPGRCVYRPATARATRAGAPRHAVHGDHPKRGVAGGAACRPLNLRGRRSRLAESGAGAHSNFACRSRRGSTSSRPFGGIVIRARKTPASR